MLDGRSVVRRAIIARCRRLFWDDFGITVTGMVVGHIAAWLAGMGALWTLVVVL